ncbi:MAG: RNA 2',3'-cyclic phosphodiesterase [Neptuniibacter sp.]
MRLFLALDLPEEIKTQIESLYLDEYSHIRWMSAEQLHLTLVFIGAQNNVPLDDLIQKIAEIEFQPFSLSTREIGYFNSGVIWLGIEENNLLQQLQKKLRQKLEELDLNLERRKFTPHITLGRTKKVDADFMEHLSNHAFGFNCSWLVDSFQLKSSHLKKSGALYETEAEFQLAPND